MADTAFQTMYRTEYIKGFEQRESLVRKTVTTEAITNAQSAVFLVADSGDQIATTRGINGLIPAKADNLTQLTATLVEWNDLRRRNNFNIFASQGDGRRIMQDNSLAVLNRKIDTDIIAELATGTNDTGAAVQASLDLVMYAMTILGNNEVPMDGNISALITPAFFAYLMQTKEFGSVDYINNKPFERSLTMFRWANCNFIVHPNLTGKGTALEKCFMYHKDAVGHAINTGDLLTASGYDEEQNYSYARTTCYMGGKLLQNSGVVVLNHNGLAYAAQ